MSIGQSPQVQNLLFKSNSSIFTPTDKGLVLALAKSLPYVDEYSSDESKWDQAFRTNCKSLLQSLPEGLKP
jgi:hypothetical protein